MSPLCPGGTQMGGGGGGGAKKSTPVARILCALEQLKFKAKSTDNNLLLHECS